MEKMKVKGSSSASPSARGASSLARCCFVLFLQQSDVLSSASFPTVRPASTYRYAILPL